MNNHIVYKTTTESTILLLMEEILQQLIWRISYYLHGFMYPKWLLGISEPSTALILVIVKYHEPPKPCKIEVLAT